MTTLLCIKSNTHIHTHTIYTHFCFSVHAKHNQLSQNPLTGVFTTELEKFDFRTFVFVCCHFVVFFFWFCVLEWICFSSLFTYLKPSNLQWCLYLRSCRIFNLNQLYFCILFELVAIRESQVIRTSRTSWTEHPARSNRAPARATRVSLTHCNLLLNSKLVNDEML